ncbi:MAG TPA: MFS transporter [Thermoanaerobaculia bacterium]|nr:MFS transporter [Thermoanaerobaculia bacterium]
MQQRRWILAATILGSSMAFIDSTVINIALPVLQTDLGAGVDDVQWVVDSYLLVLSSLILAGGSLGDRLGRVRVFGAGVALFALASLWCGAAPSIGQLIAARALQGAGAALLVPGSLAIIAAAFPGNERGRAIGTWSALTALAILAGPLLGGVLVQTISWRAVFFINLPIAAVVLWMVWRRVPAMAAVEARGAIDWLGSVVVSIGLAGVTFALIEAPVRGWRSASIVIAATVGVAALASFVFVERRAKNPIVPLTLFRSRRFTGANVLTLLLYAALSGAMFLLPFELIQVRHFSPAEAGAAFLPFVGTMSLLSRFTGALADRIGPRVPLIVGPVLAGCGFLLLALLANRPTYWSAFFPGILTLGIGMAITVAPLTTTVMTSIDDERHAGAASGINNAVARVAGLLAIAIFGAMAIVVFGRELERRLPPPLRAPMLAQRTHLAAAQPPPGLPPPARADAARIVALAFGKAYRIDLIAGAVLAMASAAGAAMMGRQPRRDDQNQ